MGLVYYLDPDLQLFCFAFSFSLIFLSASSHRKWLTQLLKINFRVKEKPWVS